jgi:hypothetical protein
MPFFIPALIAGLGALGGAAANRKQTTQQSSSQNTSSTQSSMPVYGETELDVRNNILRQLLGATETTPDFIRGATEAGVQNINNAEAIRRRLLQQSLTSRGLGRTTAGLNTLGGGDINRQNQLVNFLAQMPMQEEQIRSNRLQDLSRFFATLPIGTTQTGTSSQTGTGTTTTPGNMLGGALGSGSSLAAFLYGQGAFRK